jgi:hypothetical protein
MFLAFLCIFVVNEAAVVSKGAFYGPAALSPLTSASVACEYSHNTIIACAVDNVYTCFWRQLHVHNSCTSSTVPRSAVRHCQGSQYITMQTLIRLTELGRETDHGYWLIYQYRIIDRGVRWMDQGAFPVCLLFLHGIRFTAHGNEWHIIAATRIVVISGSWWFYGAGETGIVNE